jgi:hypothetical protein
METWTFIVKTMNQVTIKPDGSASEPAPFSAEEDASQWVLWNQALDKKVAH